MDFHFLSSHCKWKSREKLVGKASAGSGIDEPAERERTFYKNHRRWYALGRGRTGTNLSSSASTSFLALAVFVGLSLSLQLTLWSSCLRRYSLSHHPFSHSMSCPFGSVDQGVRDVLSLTHTPSENRACIIECSLLRSVWWLSRSSKHKAVKKKKKGHPKSAKNKNIQSTDISTKPSLEKSTEGERGRFHYFRPSQQFYELDTGKCGSFYCVCLLLHPLHLRLFSPKMIFTKSLQRSTVMNTSDRLFSSLNLFIFSQPPTHIFSFVVSLKIYPFKMKCLLSVCLSHAGPFPPPGFMRPDKIYWKFVCLVSRCQW